MENYAIDILEKEIILLEKCLTEWEDNNYPEARKIRIIKLEQLKQAVRELKF